MSMLRSKLYEYEMEKKREATRKIEDSKLEINFGSQIRSYVLQPYRVVKDHRTKVEIGDVDRVRTATFSHLSVPTWWHGGAINRERPRR